MNASAIFDYEAQPKERVEACNLCGGTEFANLAKVDRYGYPVRTDGCLGCGLVFLNPRMTRHAYARFYEDGAYRRLVSAFHGREINAETIQPEQLAYAVELAWFLEPSHAKTLLDIGGSTGVVARYLADRFGLLATVLDPALRELAEARGVGVIPSTIEDFDPASRRYDLVTLCQAVDHLPDIAGTLCKIRGCLSDAGRFFVDIADFNVSKTSKMDHPYNLTESTMRNYLRRAGFHVMKSGRAQDGLHVGFLCR